MSHFAKLYSDICHIYIYGDFGRTASFDFCKKFIDKEKQLIQRNLGGSDFYDEYRRTMLTVHSYLPLIKENQIKEFSKNNRYIDETILIGFPDGMSIDEATEKFCLMLIPFLLEEGSKDVQIYITLPCNTLSPALIKVKEILRDRELLKALAASNNLSITEDDIHILAKNKSVRYITVAEAVISYVNENKFDYILPLGTRNICSIYANEIALTGSKLKLIEPTPELQNLVFKAITASITKSAEEIQTQTRRIKKETEALIQKHKGNVAIIEACTDLNMGIGLVSLNLYAEYIARQVYV